MQISARDVEREHRTQLKRWKKRRGEPSRKPPQRMHSARAIMATEPHTRQDLRQNPTIIVQYPSSLEQNSDQSLRKRKGSLKRNQVPIPNIPNPYALPSESKLSQILEAQPLDKENEDVVPPNPLFYPPPLPTKQENKVKETNTSTERLVQSSPNSSLSQKPAESLPLQHLSLLTAPIHESPPQWRPHLLDSRPVQFAKPFPDHDDLPNKTENSAAILDPPTDSSPLLTQNAPASEDSAAASEDKNRTLHNSAESINSSEDTYF